MTDDFYSTGRNDPCPCGSGRKYKKCCLHKATSPVGGFRPLSEKPPLPGLPSALINHNSAFERRDAGGFDQVPANDNRNTPSSSDDLKQALEGRTFHSEAEAHAFVEAFMSGQNQSAHIDFYGLSPKQMHHILHMPYTSPDIVSINTDIQIPHDVPFLQFFETLVAATEQKNFKPTAKGNLPRNFTRSTALTYLGEEGYAKRMRFRYINSETDFHELHALRITSELGGYLRKHKGRYIIGRDCRALLDKGGLSAFYPKLFNTYVNEFNWGFFDRYDELNFIQHSWLFSVYLLQQLAEQWQPTSVLENAFANAFPMLEDDVAPSPYTTPAEQIRRCYRLRVLLSWMPLLGLAEIEDMEPEAIISREWRIRKLPLADELFTFHV